VESIGQMRLCVNNKCITIYEAIGYPVGCRIVGIGLVTWREIGWVKG